MTLLLISSVYIQDLLFLRIIKEAVKSLAGSGFCLHFEQNIFIKYERFSKYLAFLKLTNTFKSV